MIILKYISRSIQSRVAYLRAPAPQAQWERAERVPLAEGLLQKHPAASPSSTAVQQEPLEEQQLAAEEAPGIVAVVHRCRIIGYVAAVLLIGTAAALLLVDAATEVT